MFDGKRGCSRLKMSVRSSLSHPPCYEEREILHEVIIFWAASLQVVRKEKAPWALGFTCDKVRKHQRYAVSPLTAKARFRKAQHASAE
tara:strand:+ start:67 stop:330 length:264 start_codon:yes stop_codon:yes gene_type:complete